MKKIYIFPGWEDSAKDKHYDGFLEIAVKKSCITKPVHIDWSKPLSKQIPEIEKDSILIGFSLGAILASLTAQKYKCDILIMASMTPFMSFQISSIKEALVDLCGLEFTDDVIKKLTIKNKAKKQFIMYGDKEGEQADILVKNTGHRLNKNYFKEIEKLL